MQSFVDNRRGFSLHSPQRPEIQIWYAPVGPSEGLSGNFYDLALESLSSEEKGRAQTFMFERDREEFIASRFALRSILSRIYNTPKLPLIYNSHGKPLLFAEQSDLPHFNLSHSGGGIAIAISKDTPVGIDIESHDNGLSPWIIEELARTVFAPRELKQFQSASDRYRAFLKGWTQKEAFLKAIGTGLSYPVKEVEVCVDPAKESRLLACRRAADLENWSLQSIPLGASHYCSLAYRNSNPDIPAEIRCVEIRWSELTQGIAA
jgi:4'-phosphopantetheinyl transferase